MKLILLSTGMENKKMIQELKQLLSNFWNSVEDYTLNSENLQKIQSAGPNLVITINLVGFEFTTLTGGISYNLWNTKFVHFILEKHLKNEVFLNKPLSISMFFYCKGRAYTEYLRERYPMLPYLEEIAGWKEGSDQNVLRDNAGKMAAVIERTAKKCGMCIRLSPVAEAEIYFRQLKADQKRIELALRYIDDTLNTALEIEDISALCFLIPYMESGNGKYAWEYKSESRKVLRILYIIHLEAEYGLPLFSVGCRTKEELMEKYMVLLFALRRLKFELSEASKAEAEQFLLSAGISPFALHMVLQSELLSSDIRIYQELENLFHDSWDEVERNLFARMAEAAGKESVNEQ